MAIVGIDEVPKTQGFNATLIWLIVDNNLCVDLSITLSFLRHEKWMEHKSLYNIHLNQIFIHHCHSKISEMLHILKDILTVFYVIIFLCILLRRRQHVLIFLSIYV
jgi:hypothetical protein